MTGEKAGPIATAHLFHPMRDELLRILRGLDDEQWLRMTACDGWTVKDVALHLLQGDLAVVSRRRDGFEQRSDFADYADLVRWINDRNAAWVSVARLMSTQVICDLLATTGTWFDDYMQQLAQKDRGAAVDWAGTGPAPAWLEVAREYTEKWMHHQHICDAIGVTSLKTPEFFHPALATFIRGLPHTYSETIAPDGTVLKLIISGPAGADWFLHREASSWRLYTRLDAPVACQVTMPPETAWRRFTAGITPETTRQACTITGESALAEPLMHMVAIIA